MIDSIQALIEDYRKWLREETTLRAVDDYVEITTPYLDRHNDCLQILARRQGDRFLLTDDSYIVEDLEMSGCQLDTPRRESLLRTTLNGFGVHKNEDTQALEVVASKEDFALQKHNLVQAMLAVNDLFYLASSTVLSLFNEDVAAWLDLSRIRYTPSVKLSGASGFDHRFDYVIPKSDSHPERLVRTINQPNRDSAQSLVFSWIDTRGTRPQQSRAYAMLNDTHRPTAPNVKEALQRYDIRPISWSMREDWREELAA